jgi:uncharacterized coiled-coil protein SlyX
MNGIRALWVAVAALSLTLVVSASLLWGLIVSQQKLVDTQQTQLAEQRRIIDDLNRKVAALEVKFDICMAELRKKM